MFSTTKPTQDIQISKRQSTVSTKLSQLILQWTNSNILVVQKEWCKTKRSVSEMSISWLLQWWTGYVYQLVLTRLLCLGYIVECHEACQKMATTMQEKAFGVLYLARTNAIQEGGSSSELHISSGEAIQDDWVFVCQEEFGPSSDSTRRCGEIRN